MMLGLLLFLSLLVGTSWSLAPPELLSRRSLLQQTILTTTTFTSLLTRPMSDVAHAAVLPEQDPRMTVKIRLEQQGDSLGVQVINTKLRGRTVVAIQRVILRNFPQLQEGMILKDYASAQDLAERIRSGPFPVDLEFINLAAGGDAFSDVGTTIVTPKDALELAQQTDDDTGLAQQQQQQQAGITQQQPRQTKYSITTLSRPQSKCAIQSRRGDVLEINYEAFYEPAVDDGRKVTYDASSFRGTGQPYQTVLGSGDMIPGVDQGLYDMCPGDIRVLKIPPILGYGSRALQAFRIPRDYVGLEWRVELVSIDATIRQDNNDQTREEREGRALY